MMLSTYNICSLSKMLAIFLQYKVQFEVMEFTFMGDLFVRITKRKLLL